MSCGEAVSLSKRGKYGDHAVYRRRRERLLQVRVLVSKCHCDCVQVHMLSSHGGKLGTVSLFLKALMGCYPAMT